MLCLRSSPSPGFFHNPNGMLFSFLLSLEVCTYISLFPIPPHLYAQGDMSSLFTSQQQQQQQQTENKAIEKGKRRNAGLSFNRPETLRSTSRKVYFPHISGWGSTRCVACHFLGSNGRHSHSTLSRETTSPS